MNSIKLLILDFDGVIIESNDVKTNAFHHVFSRFPKYADEMMAFHYSNMSMSRFDKFNHLLKLMGKNEDSLLNTDIAKEFSKYVLKEMMLVPLVKGAESFLQLVTSKLPVYLASVTPAEELDLILKKRGLDHWFINSYGCPPWNKPQAIQDILNKRKTKSKDALLIGDSAGDQRAAIATGVNFLARNSGLPFEEPFPQTFSDLDEISKYFNTYIL